MFVHMTESPDLVTERHAWLLDRLFEARRVVTNDAASALGVSVDTIRRDLRSLHDQGLLRRVHGGAVPASRLPQSFTERSLDDRSARPVLAAAIVDSFRAEQVIGLDAGSTSVEIASLIPATLAVTIVTNNPAAAVALSDHRAVRVILLGGPVDLTWMATIGPETVDAWRSYRLDLGIVGVCGFDPRIGATTNSQGEVATKRALLESAAETIVPLQAEKLGTSAPFVVAEASCIDRIVVEPDTDAAALQECCDANIEVVIADDSGPSPRRGGNKS